LDINAANLRTLYIGYNAAFQQGIGQATSQYSAITMTVPAATKSIDYGFLAKIPGVREWIGPRQLKALQKYKYQIDEKPWEQTVEVDRDDIETDNIGIYNPLFTEMGQATASHYDTLAFATLKGGFAAPCYDGQYFFDTDHPVLNEQGQEISVSNYQAGSGAPWFLVDDSRAIKPLILQRRKDWNNLIRKDQETDDNVFMNKQFVYGTDARYNMGYGLWQYAFGSKAALDKAAFKDARERMLSLKGDYGRPIGVMPKKLIVPPSLETQALEIANSERDAAGATNVYKGMVTVEVVPWLA
jgi:phage major head subunit gpT-like protein